MREKRTKTRSPSRARTVSFADLVLAEAQKVSGSWARAQVDPLATMDYDVEVALKQKCIDAFWKANRLPGAPERLIRAPKPRFYRATSKRRVLCVKKTVSFIFANERVEPGTCAISILEPKLHSDIYTFAHRELKNSKNLAAAKAMSHLIIRGMEQPVVIFNIHTINGPIVHELKIIADRIRRAFDCAQGCFIYVDPTNSPYYLEAKRPPRKEIGYKKLFGSDRLGVEINGILMRYPATVFSQVNEPMLPILVNKVVELLDPRPDCRLLDLYSGYGLFSHSLAGKVREAVGVDAEGPAIEAARDNARRLGNQGRAFFIAGRMSASLIETRMRPPDGTSELALLDPPRQGAEPGVIEAIAGRRPIRALHIFCGTDQIPEEIKIWGKNGYRVVGAAPLDLFPGSANLETLILLKRPR